MRRARWRASRSSGERDAPARAAEAYVARLFNDYAPRFDTHLIKNLGYRGPALIADALSASAPGRRFASALDLGCGTGLMGEALRGRVDRLTGVDLSAAMIAKARERAASMTNSSVGDAARARCASGPRAFDLIVAADLLVYVGDLAPLFAAVASALTADGLFAFSVETCEGDGFRLEPTMRFAQAAPMSRRRRAGSGLRPLLLSRRRRGAKRARTRRA